MRKEGVEKAEIYLWSRETYFSWRTIRALRREGRMRDSGVSLLYAPCLLSSWRKMCCLLFSVHKIIFPKIIKNPLCVNVEIISIKC